MALNTVNTILATIQTRHGIEADFDADQMTVGEWSLSTDKKIVRICIAPGLCIRMATYEAFEEDMKEIQTILATCQDIQDAVEALANLAEQHKNDAAASESAAKASQDAAKASETAAKSSETNAEASKTSAANSASTAIAKAGEASASAISAAESADTATQKASEAGTSATNSANSASTASTKAGEASTSATNAATSAASADTYAKKSQSYAVGGTGTRPGEDIDNSKYYYEQSKNISQGLGGTLLPMGTVSFANLPALSNVESGWMYNVSDQFSTTSDFMEGAGNTIPAGANVYKTAEGKWDVLAGTPVTTVNGQTGNVNIDAESIDALTKTGDSSSTTVTFEQATQRANVQSGDDLATAFAKLSKYCADLKNVAFTASYGDLTGAPTALRNPYPLTFSGAVDGTYFGDVPVNIDIPLPILPSIGNGIVTVLENETPIASFGLNDVFDTEVNIDVPTLTNNLLATEPGTALDAVQGKVLKDGQSLLNLQNQDYITGNIDDRISDLSFLSLHPNGIWGHSTALSNIGLGFWVNVISFRAMSFNETSQFAIGSLGKMAVRYLNHETEEFCNWSIIATSDDIDRINRDLGKWHKMVKWFMDSNSNKYVTLPASAFGLTEFPEYFYSVATARYQQSNRNNDLYVAGIYYEYHGTELNVYLSRAFTGGLYINLIWCS